MVEQFNHTYIYWKRRALFFLLYEKIRQRLIYELLKFNIVPFHIG